MNHTDTTKLPLTCSSLNAYLIDESLLLYSKATQNVYGFEKGNAALFLQIDELIEDNSYEEIAQILSKIDVKPVY